MSGTCVKIPFFESFPIRHLVSSKIPMKRTFLLLAAISFVMSLSNGSHLQAQTVPMSLTAPGTNNVVTITVRRIPRCSVPPQIRNRST